MKSYREYITEAKVSEQNLDKVADIFKKMFEKRLATKLYRYGGNKGRVEIKNGIGILYLYQPSKAMRINYIKGEIVSITLWNSYRLDTIGDLTIDLGGMGLLQAGKKLLEVIQRPVVGKIPVYPELVENTYLIEAKRISPADFGTLVNASASKMGQKIDSLTWDSIAAIAIENDCQIPTKIRGMKNPGRGNKTYDLSSLLTGEDSTDAVLPKTTEPIYYVKVISQDPLTKKFQTVKGDKTVQDMYKKIDTVVNAPTPAQIDKMRHDPQTLFGLMCDLVRVVCRGARNALIVYGGPGIGKTFEVTKTIKEEGLSKDKDWHMIKGKITATSLYQTLFIHRKGGLLVFDDTDSVWKDKEAPNILKAALDSYDTRTISWLSDRTVNVSRMTKSEKEEFNDELDMKMDADPEKPHKFPSEFDYDGRIIFISNLREDQFDPAVLTRSAKLDMTLTDKEIFQRIESILEYLGDKSVNMDVKREILDFLKTSSINGNIKNISLRTFVAAEDLYRSGLPNWRDLLGYM